jgi:hypothetical protein
MKKAYVLVLLLLTVLFSAYNSDNKSNPATDEILTFIFQDFEGSTFPPAGWSLGSGPSIWSRYVGASGYGNGQAALMADFYSVSSGSQEFISANFNPTIAGDSLVFDHAYATYQTEVDRLEIYYSINGGSSWTLLVNLLGGVSGPLVTAPPTTNVFVPTASQWATKRYNLPAGVNKVKFTGISAYGNNLYVDNIRVGQPFTNDVAAISIDAPLTGMLPGSTAPKVTVKNMGTATQSFPVTLTITPGGYSNTQNVTNLSPGTSLQVTFSTVNLNTVGMYNIKSYVQLGSDQNRSNDTATSTTFVSTSARNVMLEYCTGTWCQWCPCGKTTAEAILTQFPQTIVLAYHGPANGSDPFSFFNGNAILSMLSFSGYPTGIIDRTNNPGNYAYPTWQTAVSQRYQAMPVTPVSLLMTAKNYNPSTRQLTATIDAKAIVTLSGQYKINYVIYENNIVYNQTGNGTCPGGSSYVHKWLVRNMVNGAAGENINSGTWNQNQTITKTLTTTIDNQWQADNCYFVVFAYKDASPLYNAEMQMAFKHGVTAPMGTEPVTEIPSIYQLGLNYPNPFNPSTNVKFSVPKSGHATFRIYDVTGQLVSTELDEKIEAGNYNVLIDAGKLSSGVYFYTLSVNGFVDTKKMTIIK